MDKPFTTFREIGHRGRLGNQLFEIAGTIGIAVKHGFDYFFPPWKPGRRFIHELPTRPMRELRRIPTYPPARWMKEPYDIHIEGTTNFAAHFESIDWFRHCQDLIRWQFEPQPTAIQLLQMRYAAALAADPCALHIRRGDTTRISHRYKLWTTGYYDRAMAHFPDSIFLLLSDDMPWVRKHFKGPQFIYVDKQPPYMDLFLMTLCRKHIISNSTFSWWGAWLANDSRVVYPLPWNARRPYPIGLFPDHWKEVDSLRINS